MGPAPGDREDPDLWDEWYDADAGELPTRGFGWGARVLAVVLVLALAVLMIMAG